MRTGQQIPTWAAERLCELGIKVPLVAARLACAAPEFGTATLRRGGKMAVLHLECGQVIRIETVAGEVLGDRAHTEVEIAESTVAAPRVLRFQRSSIGSGRTKPHLVSA